MSQSLLTTLSQDFVLWQIGVEKEARVESITDAERLDLIEMFADSLLHSDVSKILDLKQQIIAHRSALSEVES